MKAEEVAEELGVTTATVLRYRREGLLTGIFLPGGAIRFRRTDIDVLVASGAPRRDTA